MSNNQTLPQDNKRKQALLLVYDQNRKVQELRQKCMNKRVWQNQKHQKLHSKLDILEKDFLAYKSVKKDMQPESKQYSQFHSMLEVKLSKTKNLPQQLRQKVQALLKNYTMLHDGNENKVGEIERLKEELEGKSKEVQKWKSQLELERKSKAELQYCQLTKLQQYSRSERKWKLMWQ